VCVCVCVWLGDFINQFLTANLTNFQQIDFAEILHIC